MTTSAIPLLGLEPNSANDRKRAKDTSTSPTSRKPPTTAKSIILAEGGDVVLVVGSPPSVEIMVSCSWLTRFSPVFKGMLTGRFAEGQIKRSPEQPQHIVLPDDDAKAILDLCNLLYHRVTEYSSTPLTANRMSALVSAADKYDCLSVLRLQILALVGMHFDKVPTQRGLEQAVLRAATAYLLGERKFFKLATNQLIVHFNSPLSRLRREPGGEILPTSALLAMAEKRSHAQRVISSQLGTGGYACDCGDVVGTCEYHNDLLETFNVQTWPPEFGAGGRTLAEMLEAMRKERTLVAVDDDCCGALKVDLMGVVDEVERICEGLCIECTRADAHEVSGKVCRHVMEESA